MNFFNAQVYSERDLRSIVSLLDSLKVVSSHILRHPLKDSLDEVSEAVLILQSQLSSYYSLIILGYDEILYKKVKNYLPKASSLIDDINRLLKSS